MTANRHYLVRFGRPGFVGRFAAESPLARGERVVVRGPRGVEMGEVLVSPEFPATLDGEVLRIPTPADDAESERLERLGRELLAATSQWALPLAFVDVEVTLEGAAILHALAWDACDATPLLDELGTRFGLAVRLLDLSRTAAARDEGGCGKPGCGSEGGGCSSCGSGGRGCSSGSCSRGALTSPDELTAYFADLRHQMEDAGLVRTPLN